MTKFAEDINLGAKPAYLHESAYNSHPWKYVFLTATWVRITENEILIIILQKVAESQNFIRESTENTITAWWKSR